MGVVLQALSLDVLETAFIYYIFMFAKNQYLNESLNSPNPDCVASSPFLGMGGFWTGAGLGGLMGYFMRGRGYGGYGGYNRGYNRGYFNRGYGGGGMRMGGGGTRMGGGGSRTATSFAGSRSR